MTPDAPSAPCTLHAQRACLARGPEARRAALYTRAQPGRDLPASHPQRPRHAPSSWRVGRTFVLAGVVFAVALAGCGVPRDEVRHVVGGAGGVARAVTSFSRQLVRSWCPQALTDGGRELSQAQARGCLARAWQDWLRELRRSGYDPVRVADGR